VDQGGGIARRAGSKDFSPSLNVLDGVVGARGYINLAKNWYLPYRLVPCALCMVPGFADKDMLDRSYIDSAELMSVPATPLDVNGLARCAVELYWVVNFFYIFEHDSPFLKSTTCLNPRSANDGRLMACILLFYR
jgi:hypothetical protein